MEYLHSHREGVIVHSDLKPSNILLDDNMTAHVSDFELAKIISTDSSSTSNHTSQSSLITMKGSIGYVVRPEKFQILEKGQNRKFDYKIVISVKNS